MAKIEWDKLEKQCNKTNLPINLEALIGKQEQCLHKIAIPTKFELVLPNYEIAEVICVNCGKIVGLLARKTLPKLSFSNLSKIEAENKKEVK